MVRIANTLLSTAANGNREDLDQVVSRITPEDTPIYSMIAKETTKSTHPEWEIDELAVPAENSNEEGDEFDFSAIQSPARVGNYTQIFRKTWVVSETQEAVDSVGSIEKVKYQKLKKAIELRKDIEFAILSDQASSGSDPRKSGGLNSWYETNVSRGAGGANGGFVKNSGTTSSPTQGAKRAFDKQLLDSTMQQVYTSGGNVRFAVCSPYVKSVFTSFMSDSSVAQFRYAATEGKNSIVATADIYEGDFGKVVILPNRVQATNSLLASSVHLLDPELLSMKMLRKIQNVRSLARTGDARKGVIIGEGTLCVKNEKGLGVVADLFGLSRTV